MQLIPLTGTITIFINIFLFIIFQDAAHTPHGDEKYKALRLCVKTHGLRALQFTRLFIGSKKHPGFYSGML